MLTEIDYTPKAISSIHTSVLLENALHDLDLHGNVRFLDGTLGLGGHSVEILQSAPLCQLCGLDRDKNALNLAEKRLEKFRDRIHLFHLPFADFEQAFVQLHWLHVDGVLLDLGVSSLQLDDPGRGFSFRQPGPLDMRMDQSDCSKRAVDIVNKGTHTELKDCFATLGEEPMAARIARCIIEARQKEPIRDTAQLAEIVKLAYPPAWRKTARRHPATRCFQALRMAVNDELGQLKYFLDHIWPYISPGGRLVVISFHSLEDRMVKHAMRAWAKNGTCCIIHKKPIVPGEDEISHNPRASSAKLRSAIKLESRA